LSSSCADKLVDCQADREYRSRDKPSDHIPLWVELKI
jgi:exodeoxyribonuclease-3